MSLLPLTLSISLCLVFTFVVFFLREQARRSLDGAGRTVPVDGASSRSAGARGCSDPPPAD